MMAAILTTASLHWPQSRCRGREQVTIVNAARLDQLSHNQPRVEAWALGATCQVLISPARVGRQPARQVCRLLVHEFGHLAGLHHSDKPNSVMFPMIGDLRVNTPDCWRLGSTIITLRKKATR